MPLVDPSAAAFGESDEPTPANDEFVMVIKFRFNPYELYGAEDAEGEAVGNAAIDIIRDCMLGDNDWPDVPYSITAYDATGATPLLEDSDFHIVSEDDDSE